MKRIWIYRAALAAAMCLSAPAGAVVIGFAPQDQTVTLGSQATVDVVLDPEGSWVSTYDLTIDFDASIVAVNAVNFGTALDGWFQDVVRLAGQVNVAELSFLFDFSALQDQATPFTLFSLVFDTLAVGTSALDVTTWTVGDEWGTRLPAPTPAAGSIEVVAAPTAVAEPESFVLLGLGAATLLMLRIFRGRAAGGVK